MRFLSARKARRVSSRSERSTFRPRLEALEDRCLLSAGALDASFGSGGEVLASVPGAASASGNAVITQPDGKIVVGGNVRGSNGSWSFALARFNTNGSLDGSFGTGGFVQTVMDKWGSGLSGLALQSDGMIVAVGQGAVGGGVGGDQTFAVVRYTKNGALDPTFGGSGIVLTNVTKSGADSANAVAIDSSGRIDVVGFANNADFALVRYLPNGALDTSFGPNKNGIVVTPKFGNGADSAQALTIQPSDGKIVVAGSAGSAMAVARYTTTGLLDSTNFGSNGIWMGVPSGFTSAAAFGVLLQNNLGIVVAGASYYGGKLTLARLTSTTGQLDTTFGSSGFVVSTPNGTLLGITQGGNGDLLATGNALNLNNNNDFKVAAFLPTNGAPDTTFGSGGIATADFSGNNDRSYAIAIQGDGKIVVAGTTSPSAGTSDMALARLLAPTNTFTVSPNPVKAISSITLYVSNIMDTNLTGPIQQVAFYRDTNGNGNGILEVGTDTFLGYGTSDSNGTWSLASPNGFGLTSGNYTLFAQASDGVNVSIPLVVTLQVI
jgi:uncharacterized delta-60 repeat protein